MSEIKLNVRQRQMNLKFLNYYHKEIDGDEGEGTKKAYTDFQKDFGLDVDGVYGVETDTKLIAVIKEIQKKIGAKVDGVAGTETKQKCKEYQKKKGLKVDGICGKNTRAKLDELTWDDIKYFKKSEFDCKCGCGLNNINLKVVKIADDIREYFGVPFIVNSGSRCAKHNKKVGGVSNSRHLSGKAVDLYGKNLGGTTLITYTKKLVSEGKLRYTYRISENGQAVHIDIL